MSAQMRSSFFLLISALFSLNCYAAKPPLKSEPTFEDAIRGMTSQISKGVEKTSEFIDITLAGKQYTTKVNESTVNITQLVTSTEGGAVSNSTDFGFNLRLPNVEKRWQLRFSSYDEDQEARDLAQRTVRTIPRERNYGAALFFFKKLGNVRTMFQPRLQLKNPLQMDYILRFESSAERKPFRLEPKVELFANASKGTGEFASLNIIWQMRPRWELAFENQEEYREKANFFSTQHGLGLNYALSDTQGLSESIVAASENHAFHLTNLTLSAGYGEQIYKKLLKYGISPFLGFAKAHGFKGNVGISLTVEISF